jgi:hypothetical protein
MAQSQLEAIPAAKQGDIEDFLALVTAYVRTYLIIVDDPQEYTQSASDKKPRLYHPCDARAAGMCPDQRFPTPFCTRCPSALAVIEIISKVAPTLGFTTQTVYETSGSGTLSEVIEDAASKDSVVLEINGDLGGQVFGHLPHLRRPAHK